MWSVSSPLQRYFFAAPCIDLFYWSCTYQYFYLKGATLNDEPSPSHLSNSVVSLSSAQCLGVSLHSCLVWNPPQSSYQPVFQRNNSKHTLYASCPTPNSTQIVNVEDHLAGKGGWKREELLDVHSKWMLMLPNSAGWVGCVGWTEKENMSTLCSHLHESFNTGWKTFSILITCIKNPFFLWLWPGVECWTKLD